MRPIVWSLLGLFTLAATLWLLFPPRHQHCIHAAKVLLRQYAAAHDGVYPTSEKGWGDALLKLHTLHNDPSTWIPNVTGVGDTGSIFHTALETHTDIDERQCSRIYVQGLTLQSPPGIALLFDRHPVRGGDHGRCRLRAPVHEVIYTGSGEMTVSAKDWPTFVANQRQRLRAEGFTEEAIEAVYP